MTDTIGTNGSMRLSNRACGHSPGECHVACFGAEPLREYYGPLDQIRPDGGTCESGTAGVRRAVRSPDPGEAPAAAAAAERKAADQTALATRALSLQQKEWRRAEALAANNQSLQDACHALRRELVTAREEATAARIRTCRLDYQLSTLREQYVVELRHLHREATEQARNLRAELAAAGREIDDLRATLSRVREQVGFVDGQARITNERARITDDRARIADERARIADERARVVRERDPVTRAQTRVTRDRPGAAVSPAAGRHRRRTPSHRSTRRGLWPVPVLRARSRPKPRSSGLSWMRSGSEGIHCPALTSIVTWLIRLR